MGSYESFDRRVLTQSAVPTADDFYIIDLPASTAAKGSFAHSPLAHIAKARPGSQIGCFKSSTSPGPAFPWATVVFPSLYSIEYHQAEAAAGNATW